MKRRTNYVIDHAAKEVIITNSFAKAAGQYNSEEFKLMVAIRKDFPDYVVKKKTIQRSDNKETYKGLSIPAMKSFLKDDEENLKKLCKVEELSNGKYAVVKKWFLDNFKDEYVSQIDNITKTTAEEKATSEDVA